MEPADIHCRTERTLEEVKARSDLCIVESAARESDVTRITDPLLVHRQGLDSAYHRLGSRGAHRTLEGRSMLAHLSPGGQ